MTELAMTNRWTLLVPVKSTQVGKSRLALPADARVEIAKALAVDTVIAISTARRVDTVIPIVETPADCALLAPLPKTTPYLTNVRGLNEAIIDGAAHAAGTDGFVAVLPGDLPSLKGVELDAALADAQPYARAVVADHDCVGTTLLTSRSACDLDPHYGAGSLLAHLSSGAMQLVVPQMSGLRRDVDTLADVRTATGPCVTAAMASVARLAQ